MFDPRADCFFEDPRSNRSRPNDYGVLRLLRRDILFCLSAIGPQSQRALWPGAMAIFAGIDLAAKFYKGDDAFGQVGSRFTEFVRQYFQSISTEGAETLYQLRNALLHSFGLYSRTKKKVYRFTLTACDVEPLIQPIPPEAYQVDLIVLHTCFERALCRYGADLDKQDQLQKNFLRMFDNYGAIHIG